MKTILLFFSLLLYTSFSFAQVGSSTFLTWMKGDNTINQTGIYGEQGMADTANKPGARDFSATWKDNNGNLWLFGGYGFDGNSLGYLNDLWKYNPSTNTWTWVKGNSTINQEAVYGAQGVAKATNKPGAIYAGVSWTDNNGNLWLFGGFGYTANGLGLLNDLWKYDPVANKWTWMKGDKIVDKVGIYGTQGIPNATNKPGARYSSRTWTDSNGNLWLFGGYGYDAINGGYLNDLWKYDPSANQWTWVKGDNAINQPGVYGVQGVANVGTKPGARYISASWTDANGNLWLFGGYGYSSSVSGILNDLWKYNPATDEWTWVKGDNAIDQSAVYGELETANNTNKPGARYISVSWTDAIGDLWLFGGYGYDAGSRGYLNDLWKYNPATNEWTWVKGDNQVDQVGVYGTQGMPSVTNKSGARTSCVSWTGGSGDLWLFGGYGYDASTSGNLNDLWKISSFMILPVELIYFNGVLNDDVVNLQWQAAQELNFSHFNIQRSFDGIHFASIAKVNGTGGTHANNYNYRDNDLKNYQSQKVFYRLQLMDADGQFTYSKIIRFDMDQTTAGIHIFPNPAMHSLNLSFDQNKQGLVAISITDMNGTVLKKQTENINAGRVSISVDVSTLPSAAYIISAVNEAGTIIHQKFIKQ
jgi:hypothetical protein